MICTGRGMRRVAGGLVIAWMTASAALAASPAHRVPAGVQVLGLRTGPHGDTLRIVLDLDAKTSAGLRSISEGTEWRVALTGIAECAAFRDLSDPHPLVASIAHRLDGRVLEITMRARRPVRATASWIPPRKGKTWRYVIEVTAAQGRRAAAAPTAPSATVLPAPRDTDAAPPTQAPVEPEPAPRRAGKWRILIDPGHGGSDPGARRGNLVEKEIVFDVAQRVASILNDTDLFEARLSRTDDRLIGLRERHAIAESYDADAFVSVHVNAAPARKAMGVEVFFLSMRGASDEASRELARLENAVDPSYVYEEDSLLQNIPFSFDLRQSDTLLRSSRLAESVLSAFEQSHLAASRGVKQAGFAVMKSFQVPSILVEVGFLSNPQEGKRLANPAHRQKLADSIARGTVAYFEKYARARQGTGEAQ